MSDKRLRELDRRWRESGSTADEAAYLLERVRIGEWTRDRRARRSPGRRAPGE